MKDMSLCGFIESQCRGKYIETFYKISGWLTIHDPEWVSGVSQILCVQQFLRKYKN